MYVNSSRHLSTKITAIWWLSVCHIRRWRPSARRRLNLMVWALNLLVPEVVVVLSRFYRMVCIYSLFFTNQPLLTPRSLDFEPANLQDLVDDLFREKFEPYITSVGGSGLGILSPYPEQRNRDVVPSSSRTYEDVPTFEQVTPPETPVPESQEHLSISFSGGENTLRVPFEAIPIDGLAEWANGQGQWLYV